MVSVSFSMPWPLGSSLGGSSGAPQTMGLSPGQAKRQDQDVNLCFSRRSILVFGHSGRLQRVGSSVRKDIEIHFWINTPTHKEHRLKRTDLWLLGWRAKGGALHPSDLIG